MGQNRHAEFYATARSRCRGWNRGELEGDAMEFPKALTVGQTLPDASMTMKASVDGMGSVMSTTINITDRKIEGKESVTLWHVRVLQNHADQQCENVVCQLHLHHGHLCASGEGVPQIRDLQQERQTAELHGTGEIIKAL